MKLDLRSVPLVVHTDTEEMMTRGSQALVDWFNDTPSWYIVDVSSHVCLAGQWIRIIHVSSLVPDHEDDRCSAARIAHTCLRADANRDIRYKVGVTPAAAFMAKHQTQS